MNDLNLPPEILSKPFSEWQLDLTTLVLVVMIFGRAFAALRSGGGLVGIARSIWYGSVEKKETYEKPIVPAHRNPVPDGCPLSERPSSAPVASVLDNRPEGDV